MQSAYEKWHIIGGSRWINCFKITFKGLHYMNIKIHASLSCCWEVVRFSSLDMPEEEISSASQISLYQRNIGF